MKRWIEAVRSRSLRPSRIAWTMMSCGLCLLFISTLWIVSTASAQPTGGSQIFLQAQGAAEGQQLFSQDCTGCHTIGGGKLIGPDLKDVTTRVDPQWLKSFILNPTKMLDSDPTAQSLLKEYNNTRMPNFGFTPDQVDSLIAYLANPGALPALPTTAPATTGSVAEGKQLFTGELALTNGGPPCMSCHTVSGSASLGGGSLGPDLTHVVQRLGTAGVSSALKKIAFPTMIGPFQDHPLTANEQADLVAFLRDADRQQGDVQLISPGSVTINAGRIFGIGLAVAVLLFALLLFFWNRIQKRTALRLPVRKV